MVQRLSPTLHMNVLLLLVHIAALAAGEQVNGERWIFHPKSPTTPPFSLDKLKANVDRTIGKLLFENEFENRTLYSGVAGGNQFATIWVRDFCHATGGLLLKPTWRIGENDVPSKHIVLSTLTEILKLVKDGEDDSKIQIPRALDSLGPREDLLTFKVLAGGASLKKKVVWPFGEKDPGVGMQKFPSGAMYGYFNGEAGANETCDAGYLLISAFTRVAPLLTDAELTSFLETSGQKLKLLGFATLPEHQRNRMNTKKPGDPMIPFKRPALHQVQQEPQTPQKRQGRRAHNNQRTTRSP
eukprot:Skav213206  [mRNA]  locus=scaffold2826:483789:492955:- [translate_table: standard]